MSIISLEDSFETLTKKEWDDYITYKGFSGLNINLSFFTSSKLQDIVHSNKFVIEELVHNFRDELFSLKVSYALCRHYFSKGIPDDKVIGVDIDDEDSTRIFPNFNDEHWMRRYWFCYFADVTYSKLTSLLDSLYYILANHYFIEEKRDSRHNNRVLNKIKIKDGEMYNVISSFQESEEFKEAKRNRNYTHGSSVGNAHDRVKITRNVKRNFPELDSENNILFDDDGKIKTIERPATEISFGIGDYISSNLIMNNIELTINTFSDTMIKIKKVIDTN